MLVNKRTAIPMVLLLVLAIHATGQTLPESESGGSQTGTVAPQDSSRQMGLLLATEGGGGFNSGPQPTAYAGIKFGGDLLPRPWTWNVNLGYDRVHGQNGFSAETSGVLVPGAARRFL